MTNSHQADMTYHIVGQGLAGTILAHELAAAGLNFRIYDVARHNSSSQVAAGLMNPFTGRNFVKSWMYDELYKVAAETYTRLEAELGSRFFFPHYIVRALADIKMENDFWSRAETEDFIVRDFDAAPLLEVYGKAHSFVALRNGGRCDLKVLCALSRKRWLAEGRMFERAFEEGADRQAGDKVIYCEGVYARDNALWGGFQFRPAKGEVLLVKIDNYPFADYIVKHDLMIVPQSNGLYWVGSNYDNHFDDDLPTEAVRQDLEERLREVLKLPFEVVEHVAAVRPTTYNRRPFVAKHEQLADTYIFNGLGTKGTSLAPYFAKEMLKLLREG